ncbi:MAG: hypothetical protein AAFX81_05795 [Pseudomonadota bacterium]
MSAVVNLSRSKQLKVGSCWKRTGHGDASAGTLTTAGRLVWAAFLFAGLGGCGELTVLGNTGVTVAGSRTVVLGEGKVSQGNDFVPVDVVDLLVPGGRSNVAFKKQLEATPGANGADQRERAIGLAFAFFNADGSDEQKAIRRNQIQDRLLAVSEQRCSVWKQYIQTVDSSAQGFLGSLATVAGGVGALLTNSSARISSGISGIASGLRGDASNALLAGQFVGLVTAGVAGYRDNILGEINGRRYIVAEDKGKKRRKTVSTNAYSVAEAIFDAERYHGGCSLVAGLQYAKVTLNKEINEKDSIEDLGAAFDKLKTVNKQMQILVPEPDIKTKE